MAKPPRKPPAKTADKPKAKRPSRAKATPKPAPEAKGSHLRVVENTPPKKGRGVQHEPTAHSRAMVMMGVGCGYTQEQLARKLEINVITLRKHYENEIENGTMEINLAVAANLAGIAKNPNHPKCVTAAIWWTKARMGWKDGSQPAEDEDDDGEVIEFTVKIGEASGGKG